MNQENMGRACSTWKRSEMCTTLWTEKPEGKRPLRRPRHRWEDSIKMDLNKTG
jgi:hypothetical protein